MPFLVSNKRFSTQNLFTFWLVLPIARRTSRVIPVIPPDFMYTAVPFVAFIIEIIMVHIVLVHLKLILVHMPGVDFNEYLV